MNTNDSTLSVQAPDPDSPKSTIPCHCIVAHPEKPKFLVIRHSGDSWSPPTLGVPAGGALMYKPAVINRGMMNKYRLRTTVLRIIIETNKYALIELELHASSQQQMQAVWVGADEYQQFRQPGSEDSDPFVAWLDQQERGLIPPRRAPWQLPGWYKEAERWFSTRLVEQGIQVTGSTQQFKAGWPTACLLRSATAQGDVFLKATYAKPPGEARLTAALAKIWPEHVPEPLAVDEARNWMLMRDYRLKDENKPGFSDLPEFSRTLAKIQIESMKSLEEFRAIGCTDMNHDFLCNKDGKAQALLAKIAPLLSSGPLPLDTKQVRALNSAFSVAHRKCEELQAFGIPDSFSHLDYRPDNFFVENGQVKIIDWADVAITHPFMAMCRTLDFLEHFKRTKAVPGDIRNVDVEDVNNMLEAYLDRFSEFVPPEKLQEAFACARSVYTLFYLLYVAGQLQLIEPGTPQADLLQHLLCSRALALIEQAKGD